MKMDQIDYRTSLRSFFNQSHVLIYISIATSSQLKYLKIGKKFYNSFSLYVSQSSKTYFIGKKKTTFPLTLPCFSDILFRIHFWLLLIYFEGGIVNNTLRPPIPKRCDSEWKKLMEECWSADPASRPSFTEITNRLRDMSMALPKKRQNVTSRRV